MAIGAVVSAFYLYKGFEKQKEMLKKQELISKEQKEQFIQSRFDDHFFNMVQTFYTIVEGLSLTIKRKKLVDEIEIEETYSGVKVFEGLAKLYLPILRELPVDKMNSTFNTYIKDQYDSKNNQIFNLLVFIYDNINKNCKIETRNFYYEYLIINMPEYLKFIIALYKIHDPENDLAKKLIKDLRIIKDLDFKNYIKNDAKYNDFMTKVYE
jgi:hypothetical protein